MAARQMHLVGYLIAGPTWHNNGGWRHPESDADMALDARRYEQHRRRSSKRAGSTHCSSSTC